MIKDKRTAGWPEAQGFSMQDFELIQDLWNHARTARLSELYYGQRLVRLNRVNFTVNLLIAGFSSGSGIAGWALWEGSIEKTLWAAIAGVAAVLGVARPFLDLDHQIEKATRQQGLYRTLLIDLENLVFDIRQTGFISSEQHRRYMRAVETLRVGSVSDDPTQSPRRVGKLQKYVLQEMPAEKLWVPAIEHGASVA